MPRYVHEAFITRVATQASQWIMEELTHHTPPLTSEEAFSVASAAKNAIGASMARELRELGFVVSK